MLQLRAGCRLQCRRTTQGVAHDQLWGGEVLFHPLRHSHNVVDVLAETGVFELTAGLAEAREIKTQRGNAVFRQAFRDA